MFPTMDLSFERKTEKINGKSHHVLETVSFYIAFVVMRDE